MITKACRVSILLLFDTCLWCWTRAFLKEIKDYFKNKKQPSPQKHTQKNKKATQTLITSHHMLMQFAFAAGSALLVCRARPMCVLLTVLWPLLWVPGETGKPNWWAAHTVLSHPALCSKQFCWNPHAWAVADCSALSHLNASGFLLEEDRRAWYFFFFLFLNKI